MAPAAVHAKVTNPALTEVQELAQAGRGGEAMRRIDALIAKDPQDPQLRFQKGVLLVEQKRTAEAIALFERMGRDFPTLPEPLNNLAVLYAEQGQIEKARAALESAVRSRPSYDTAYQNLASVNVRLASRAYARALQIDDSSGTPRLSMLKTLQGSHQDSPVTVAAAPPPLPLPAAPAPVPAPAAAPAEPPAPAPVRPAVPPDEPARTDAAGGSTPPGGANPATASSAQRRTTEVASEVNAAVRAWATAWERKDMADYIGAYVPGFRGSDGSAADWQSGRRQRIVGKSRISVDLSGVTVEVLPDNVAKVSFRQDYVADQLRVSSRKQLELVKRDGKWLIRKETVL
jgi:tetratricopeptide (TPR) repeat protein